LRQVTLLNNRCDLCWHVTRWDYLFWSFKPDDEKIRLKETVFIWETESGQIAAVLTLKIAGAYSCKSPPDFCATELETEMIAIAEKHLTSATLDRDRKPRFWVSSGSQDKARL